MFPCGVALHLQRNLEVGHRICVAASLSYFRMGNVSLQTELCL